ncbi:MAG: hypothetical protein ACOYNS_03560 [Bacteroidota bacterium]
MEHKISIRIGIWFFTAAVLLSQIAFAVGTPAGTVIQSRSKVVFSSASGAVVDTVYSNTLTFTVAQVAAVNITPSSNAVTTQSDSTYSVFPVTVTNSGNGSDQFNLSSVSSKGWTRSFYYDANGDGTLQGTEITAGAITQTSSIAADGTYKLFIRVFVPKDPSLNGQIDTTTLTATSVFDVAKTNTSQARTTVNTAYFPNITSGWSVTPTNPSPGQNVVYSITITNGGSVAATGVTFNDLFNTSQFSLVSANTSQGTVNTSGNPVIWSAGTVNPGSSVTVSITLQVNNGLVNGTVLNNTIGVSYSVNGNTFTATSNNPSAAVGVIRGVQISPLSISAAKEPEDTLVYPFTVKNNGNAKDVLEMEYSSSRSYNWSFFKDVNANGQLNAGDVALSNTNNAGGVDVDSVAAYDSVKVLARLIVPDVSADQTQDVTSFTVRSAFESGKFQSANGTTTINIADVQLVRSVLPEGNQIPGTEMTFTVTYNNAGHGKAYNTVITETEPDSMTYTANSVKINGTAKTDAADSDEVTVSTVSGRKVITINLGILNGLAAEATVVYKATVK